MAPKVNSMNDDEYIESIRKDCKESVEFYSSSSRHEREKWVANEFLTNLKIIFEQAELEPVTDDPPDVRFRSAEFEIKEILDPGRLRHKESKEALEKAMDAKDAKDFIEHYVARDIKYTEIFALVEVDVKKYADKYPDDVKKSMDLLFYVNLKDTRAYTATPIPPQGELSKYGFRSISFVSGPLSAILMANNDAPEFLRNGGPRVIRKENLDI
jgi:hypothetical protein